jgi:Plasmid pRiA4b ORF-3-like protein
MPLIYQFKITIRYTSPPIWRRIQISADSTFKKLHETIQVLFQWSNSHLHHFKFTSLPQSKCAHLPVDFRHLQTTNVFIEQEDEVSATTSEFYTIQNLFSNKLNQLMGIDSIEPGVFHELNRFRSVIASIRTQYSEEEECLYDWFSKEKERCIYTYDFGDDWQHEIVLEKIIESDETLTFPICLKARELPPVEDSGGYWEEDDEVEENTKYGYLKQNELDEINQSLKRLSKRKIRRI